ncbi:MAG: YkgJ family cysteine cluster protein [Candidatus Latescibacterota bacterium]|jgi:Fe-S-cluster containining protein|tara:strand:- start:533 stop:1021 length:489 start_codon:yes stop_codon:yes gene_type:complete
MADTNAEQDLCKNCGFCCDDTLFPHGSVKKDEVLPPGFEEVIEKGKRYFTLPCPHFNGTCTIYHQGRPKICGTFQCAVLEKSIAAEISFTEAAQFIAQIKTQKARLNQQLAAYPGATITDRYNEFQRQNSTVKNTAEFRLQHKDLLMEWVLFKTRLKRFNVD